MPPPYRVDHNKEEHVHIERIWQHDTLYWHTMSRATPRQGYVLFTNPALPQRYDPNHAGYFRLQSDAQAQDAIRDIIAFYDALGFDSVAYVDHCATPTTLAHLLMQHGFVPRIEWGITDLLVLDRFLPPAHNPRITVNAVISEQDKHEWAMLNEPNPHSSPAVMYALGREEIANSSVCGYLARIDGIVAGRCLRYTDAGISRIEAVFVAEHLRRHGVARQLVAQAIADATTQSELVYLFAIHDYHAATLYQSLGMRTYVHDATVTYVRSY